ncbi:unnamed protein product [marine sediment metagenome]|uniref:Uncharacterized protein n=1 Tax=marine sediment metagenome TaxID=412755 RepID=X1B5E1_9ZZZZ
MKCKGCDWCQLLAGVWVCARGKHRFSKIDPEKEFPDDQGKCYEKKAQNSVVVV